MTKKFLHLLPAIALVLASLACNLSPAASDPTAARTALLAQIPSPTGDKPQADKTFVGAVEGSQTYIGLVIQNGTVVVYICDGGDVSEWFGGQVADGKLDFTSDKGTHLVATSATDLVTGTLTLSGGQPLAFSAIPAVEGQTGLFRHKGDKDNLTYLTGWIVTQTGARGETDSANGAQNGLVINISPDPGQQTLLRIRSDDHEYTVAKEGIGFNLHHYSVLELPVTPGQNDFDYFCNDTKFFAGGIVVPEGNILTVDLVAEGCQALPAPPVPVPPRTAPAIPITEVTDAVPPFTDCPPFC
jgi:hypothetical protein